MAKQHFCTEPMAAVCEYPLVPTERFHRETTATFASVSCDGCREWLRKNRLRPNGAGGFPDPVEWKS